MTTALWWFVAMNAVVVAIAVLSSSCPRPPSTRRHRSGITRRTSSAVLLQSLRSFSIFSFPSASSLSSYLHPDAADAAATTDQETETETETEELAARSPPPIIKPSTAATPRAVPLTLATADEEEEEEEEEDPNAMSMDEAYALVVASQQRPEREREEEARRSEVDAKAEEFIRRFKEDLRQQRLNSVSNYNAQTSIKRQAPASGSGRR